MASGVRRLKVHAKARANRPRLLKEWNTNAKRPPQSTSGPTGGARKAEGLDTSKSIPITK